MAISLYDISAATYLQTLGAVVGFLDKGKAHCADNGIDLDEIVEARLFDDMLPFRFQLVSVAHHSLGALKGVQSGVFRPPAGVPELDYNGLRDLVAETRAEIEQLAPDTVNALEGRDVVFEIGDRKIPFSAEGFVLSFSLPNLFFHAATAYDILRTRGVPLGKRDFMGQMRVRT